MIKAKSTIEECKSLKFDKELLEFAKKQEKQSRIRDVWMHNFFTELQSLASYVDLEYNIVAFVTLQDA